MKPGTVCKNNATNMLHWLNKQMTRMLGNTLKCNRDKWCSLTQFIIYSLAGHLDAVFTDGWCSHVLGVCK